MSSKKIEGEMMFLSKKSTDEKKILYVCHYKFYGKERKVSSDKGIDTFRNGFWIEEKMGVTSGADCKYWIPPSQILYIEKVEQ